MMWRAMVCVRATDYITRVTYATTLSAEHQHQQQQKVLPPSTAQPKKYAFPVEKKEEIEEKVMMWIFTVQVARLRIQSTRSVNCMSTCT